MTLPLLQLMERLDIGARADLTAEILGQRPIQPGLHFKQMQDLGIFSSVTAEVFAEVDAASGALQDWPDEAPTPLLLGLCDVLRGQVAALRPQNGV
jgi:octaprenyl-diphosphate synthase